MPNRILREGILSSERINSLTPNAELFYRRLMSVVDDFGRYTANTTLLRASCYPLKLDSVKEDSISKHLAECVGARLIVLYTVADKAYLELQDFKQQVRAKESKYPSPDEQMRSRCVADAEQVLADAHLDGGVVGDGDGDEGVNPLNPPMGDVCATVVKVYHEVLPRCMRCEALTPKRKKRIQHADKLARQVCKSQEWDYEPEPFWRSYFDECNDDPWLRGDVPNPNNPRWKQNLGVLLAEDRFAEIMDRAIAAMRSAA